MNSIVPEPIIDVTVVIPVYNEVDNVIKLAEEVKAALEPLDVTWELIYVDDGSDDGTPAKVGELDYAQCIVHEKNAGQSAATITGIWAAKGTTIITMDGDGQNDPAAIPELLETLKTYDMAQGIREKRNDSFGRRLASRFAYMVRNIVARDRIKDTGCSLRAFPREAALKLPQFNGVHRLMPGIFVFMGLNVGQIMTNHRPRTAGISKYGNLKRGIRGLVDLCGLFWMKRRLYHWRQTKR